MVRASISVDLGGILRRSEPLGRIYGWIPSGGLLGSVTRVPYLEELYIERNTEKLNLAENRSKTLPNAMETEVIHTTRKGKSILLYFLLILNYSIGSMYFPYKLL